MTETAMATARAASPVKQGMVVQERAVRVSAGWFSLFINGGELLNT